MTARPQGGVLLSGGFSTRLGVDKTRVVVDGVPLAQRSGDVLHRVCERIIEVGDGVSGYPHIRESPAGSGPFVAFLAGVDALVDAGVDLDAGVMLMVCDLPRMTESVLATIADTQGESVLVRIDDHLQYGCAKYGPVIIEEMRRRAQNGERSFRWLREFGGYLELAESDFGDEGAFVFRDLDTPADALELGIDITP